MDKNWILSQITKLKNNYREVQNQEEHLIRLKRQIEIEIEELTSRLRIYLKDE